MVMFCVKVSNPSGPFFTRSWLELGSKIGPRNNCKMATSSIYDHGTSDEDSEPQTRHYGPLNSSQPRCARRSSRPSIGDFLDDAYLDTQRSGAHRSLLTAPATYRRAVRDYGPTAMTRPPAPAPRAHSQTAPRGVGRLLRPNPMTYRAALFAYPKQNKRLSSTSCSTSQSTSIART